MKKSIIGNEFYKIINKKIYLIIFVILLIANCFLIYNSNANGDTYNAPASANIALYNDLSNIPNVTDKIDFLNKSIEKVSETDEPIYTNDSFTDRQLLESELDHLKTISDYSSYINGVVNESDNITSISIFANKDSYTYKNAVSTKENFENLSSIDTTYDISNGVNMATNFIFTDLLIIVILLLVGDSIIGVERNINIIGLQKTCKKGKGTLACSKIIAVLMSVTLISIIFYGANILLSSLLYGFGDLSRSIQSVYGFENCILHINVLEYLILFLIFKIFVMFIIALIINLISMLAKSRISTYIYVIIIGIISVIPIIFILDNSNIMALKYINLIQFIDIHSLFSRYLNINLFNFPINYFYVFLISIIVLTLTLITSNIFVFSRKIISGYNKFSLKSLIKIKTPLEKTSVFAHEMYKTLISNKVLYILIGVLVIQLYVNISTPVYLSDEEKYENFYNTIYSGEFNQAKIDEIEQYINDTNKLIESGELSAQSNEYSEFENFNKHFIEYYDYLNSKYDEGTSVSVVNHTSVNVLLGIEKDMSNIYVLGLYILLIVCIIPIFTREYERKSIPLLKCTKTGYKNILLKKSICAILITLAINLLIYIPYFIRIISTYGLNEINSSICSIPEFSNMSDNFTIIQVLVFSFIVRLVTSIVITLLLMLLSTKTKNTIMTVLISTVIFVIPILLNLINIDILNNITLYNFQNFGNILTMIT